MYSNTSPQGSYAGLQAVLTVAAIHFRRLKSIVRPTMASQNDSCHNTHMDIVSYIVLKSHLWLAMVSGAPVEDVDYLTFDSSR